MDMSVPLKEEDSSASGIARKPSLSQFPTLAAPSPFRKSIRNPRDSSLEPSLTTTPGTGLTGNHSSWLAKVREAKAMEVTSKRASVAPAGLAAPPGSLKRKSSETPASLPHGDDDGEERKAKILKTGADIIESACRLEPQVPVVSALPLPAVDVRAAKSADDVPTLQTGSGADMMAPLKKAIEALRARTGKSLAGNLTGMNAEEPSPVEMEVAVSKVVDDPLSQPHTLRPSLSAPTPIHGALATEEIIHTSTPPRTYEQVAGDTISPPLREGSGRLSVSDLVPNHNKDNASSHALSNETSISTTPPDSPPAKKTTFFVPGGPVFNKPPPVFVPPPAMKPERSPTDYHNNVLKGHASELPGYSLGAPFGLGLQPTKLPKSPPRGPLSAQSTQSSLFSDNVFESQSNLPTWMPRSQDTQITSQESQAVVEKGYPADIDDDDSWRIDDKFAATSQMWTPFTGIAAVEDSMTWSTVPSDSRIGKSPRQELTEDAVDAAVRSHKSQVIVDDSDKEMDIDDDMKKDILEEGMPTVSLVTVSKGYLYFAVSSDRSMIHRPIMIQKVSFLSRPLVASHHNLLDSLAMQQS
jgi:hypothetical protein